MICNSSDTNRIRPCFDLVSFMAEVRMLLIVCAAFVAMLAGTGTPAVAQEAPATESTPQAADDQALRSMSFVVQRAEIVRLLAAEHLSFLNSNRDKAEFHLLEEASQVMAYNLVCEDEAVDVAALNDIAAQTTLKVAMLVDQSPAGDTLRSLTEKYRPEDRLILIADMSSTVLMFKIGRRRGLFDALLTDFGAKRFCAGMGANMRDRFNSLVSELHSDE